MKLTKKNAIIISFALVGCALLVIILSSFSKKQCSKGVISSIGYKSTSGKDGELCQSFLGSSTAPRGVRNNNVGNLIRTNSSWKGKIPHDRSKDIKFEQFETYALGIRAMIYNLDKNYLLKGHNTIRKIIQKYTGNNTSYMSFLSQRMGIGIDQNIKNSKSEIKKLTTAIARYENGLECIKDTHFNLGWNLYKTL